MHFPVRQWIREQVARELERRGRPAFRSVLEIGSRVVNGPIRDCVPAESYLGIDVLPGAGVDLVADGATFAPGRRFECVVCCEVLEHAELAERIVRNALALLEPGGVFLVTAAGPSRAPHSGLDGGPVRSFEYYRGIPVAELEAWLRDGGALEREAREFQERGDVYARAVVA